MSAEDLPTWIRYAQALVVPVITIAGVGIAWGQLALARTRLQHDLFDRRYKIFQAARRLIAEVVREGRVNNQQVLAYRADTGDAIFLLDRDVVVFLAEMEKRAFRLAYLCTVVANDQLPQRAAAIDEESALLLWFTGQFDVLVEKFKPSLQLSRPWLGRPYGTGAKLRPQLGRLYGSGAKLLARVRWPRKANTGW